MRKVLLIIIGIISLVMACAVLFEEGKNFSDFYEFVQFCFLSLFTIIGVALIVLAIPDHKKKKDEKPE